MQVYRGLDIGTAKLALVERGGIPHHLLDCCEPHEIFSAGDFQNGADRAIVEICDSGLLPIVVGGTGLYIRALLLGLAPVGSADRELRDRLRKRSKSRGMEAMHRLLMRLDPQTAEKLPPGDSQRILRALEYRIGTGRRLSEAIADKPFGSQRYRAIKIGLRIPRVELRKRIAARVRAMIKAGWIEEIEQLLASGVSPNAHAFRAIGYREIVNYLKYEEVTLEQTIEEIIRATQQYAKRQGTWFRREKGIIWIDASSPQVAETKVINLIKDRRRGVSQLDNRN